MPTCVQRLMRDRKYKLEVDWEGLDITHRMPIDVSILTQPSADVHVAVSEPIRNVCLFTTEFTNESNETQNFTFKTERTTTSTCAIALQQGLKVGEKIDCKISLPKVCISHCYHTVSFQFLI